MNEKDTDALLVILVALLAGPALLASVFKPVQKMLINWKILVTDNVLIPIGDGAGLDLPRIIIAVCVLVAIVLLGAMLVRRTVERRALARKAGEQR
ncbi:hypothetical protein [Microbacterium panaciterrae]